MKNFAVLSAMFRPLSRSRAFRSKRHAAGTSPAHKWRSFQNFTFYWCRKKLENFEFRKNSKLRLIRNAKEKDINVLANLCAQLGCPAAPSDIAARLEKLRHKSKNHIFVAEIPFHTGENNTVAGFISFESYETIYCNAGINNPDASVGVVVLIRWLQSALIPFVTTQASGY